MGEIFLHRLQVLYLGSHEQDDCVPKMPLPILTFKLYLVLHITTKVRDMSMKSYKYVLALICPDNINKQTKHRYI